MIFFINGTDNLGNDVSFNYDSLNNLKSETNSNELINYSYDTVGNVTSINNINYTYDINIKLTDVYDFNKEEYDGTLLNNYLNVMHKGNKYGILTPIDITININEKIYEN